MTVGWPLCSTAALYAAYTLSGSCPPRFRPAICAFGRCSTSALSSGVLKKCSRMNAPRRSTSSSSLMRTLLASPPRASACRGRCTPGTRRPPLPSSGGPAPRCGRACSSGSQSLPQTTLMTFHPAPRKMPSSSWMILPLPRTGPSSRWRLQLMTQVRLSSFSRPARPMQPSDLRLVALAVAEERPDADVVGLGQAAVAQVAVEAGVVDRHDRAEAHAHRRVLPEVRHQPRVRVARTARRRAAVPGGSS